MPSLFSSSIKADAANNEVYFGKYDSNDGAEDDVIALSMTLGNADKTTKMVFTERGWQVGRWWFYGFYFYFLFDFNLYDLKHKTQTEDSMLMEYEEKIQDLTKQLKEIEHRAKASETESQMIKTGGTTITEEDVAMLKFKNQLLVEMVRVREKM